METTQDKLLEALIKALIGLTVIAASAALWWPLTAHATRIKEVATVQGVRSNQLVGRNISVLKNTEYVSHTYSLKKSQTKHSMNIFK